MRLEPTPRVDHIQRVSARLITASTILHLSSDELESAVAQEQMENPALEVNEQRICLYCGSPLHSQICASCGYSAQLTQPAFTTSEYNIDDYSLVEAEDDEEFDPLARLPMGQTLSEVLLEQLEALVSADDAPIAEQLVGNLNERGYLEISVQEIAEHLSVPVERVEYVLSQLQTLEPLGIGARDLRECLLIQLAALSEQEMPHPLAFTLIDRYLNQLGHNQFHEIARQLKVSEQEVRQASQYIRNTLHPFPAHAYRADASYTHAGGDAAYVRPDVIIRRGETGFEVELIEEKRYRFRIGGGYGTQPLGLDYGPTSDELKQYMRHSGDQARFFVDCIQRRWRTLKRVAELV